MSKPYPPQYFLTFLSQNPLHNFPLNIRQTIPPSLKFEIETLVVNAHNVHHRCLKIVDIDGVFDDIVAKFNCEGALL